MKPNNIYDLRKNWGMRNLDIRLLNYYFNEMFDSNLNFKLVIGFPNQSVESFKTQVIPPSDNESWATVNNFRLGSQCLVEKYSNNPNFYFIGEILIFGVDSMYRENIKDTILKVLISEKENKQGAFLNLKLGISDEKGAVYNSFSDIEKTPIQLNFERFLGPNKSSNSRDF